MSYRDAAPPAAARASRPWSWTGAVLALGPPLWAFVLLAEVLGMEAWRFASAELQVVEPGVRALQYALLLPFLLLACRVAVGIGYRGPHAAARIAAQLAIGAAFATLSRPALAAATALLGRRELSGPLLQSLLSPSRESAAVWIAASSATALHYAMCVGAIAGAKTYRDLEGERVLRAEVERQAVQARLQSLQNQLNPHFLFNALNTVVALIESEPRTAQTMVTRISELLRRILAESPAATVPLAHELELLERYVGIQELRFPSRLSHAFEVPEAAARARVPSLVVQPLVENAVLHGLAGHDGPVEVRLEATVADDLLTVVVTNPGGPAGRGAGGAGLGLRNVAERLATLYGARASVRLECPTAGRFRATLVVPQDADAMRTAAA